MFDTKDFNKEAFEFLKANTTLGPISLLKINKMKRELDKARDWYLKMEGELLASDYSLADELEYELRMRAWENKVASMWKKNPDGLSLFEFAEMIIEQNIENQKLGNKRR